MPEAARSGEPADPAAPGWEELRLAVLSAVTACADATSAVREAVAQVTRIAYEKEFIGQLEARASDAGASTCSRCGRHLTSVPGGQASDG